MKIAIIGSNGQLGYDLRRILSSQQIPPMAGSTQVASLPSAERRQIIPLTHQDIEIANTEMVNNILGEIRPNIVINTAAYHRVEDCEIEYNKAFTVNAIGARNLAQTCQRFGATLVHISTDYVFDGKKGEPYVEEDVPNPLNTYGVTKLAGEYFVKNYCEKHLIVRTAGLYGIMGSRAKGGSFIDTMLNLAQERSELMVVDDQIVSPSYTLDVAKRIEELLAVQKSCSERSESNGVFHVANSGQCSWYDFASKIFEVAGLKVNIKRTSQEELRSKIKRPRYSALGSSRIQPLGLEPLRHWQEALAAYVAERKTALKTI